MFERILVSVDGSDTSNQALVTATQMAKDSAGRACWRLAHVLEDALTVGGYAQFGADLSGLQEAQASVRDSGNQLLDDALQITRSAGIAADTQLLERHNNSLGAVISGAAQRWHADLVVVGTHGRHGLGRVLMGSGAEDIVRSALVPVLVVRMPAKTP